MEFEYTRSLWVDENDLNEMATLVKNGQNIENAIENVASGWDDSNYYSLEDIFEQLRDEVLRRVEKV